MQGNPVFLISGLAEHTKNLERDPRASLMVAESGADDPLANGRVTLLGPCTRVEGDDGRARAAFLAAHPNAAYYADFRDFAFWTLRVNAIRYIGGYGRMSWITQDDWQAAEADPLAPYAAGAIAHMNADHAEAMVLYCKAFSKATEVTSATMSGVDRYGFDMSAKTPEGPRPVRVAFARPVTTPDELRAALVAMAKDARSRLARIATCSIVPQHFEGIDPRCAAGREPARKRADRGQDECPACQRNGIARLETIEKRRDELRQPQADGGAADDAQTHHERYAREHHSHHAAGRRAQRETNPDLSSPAADGVPTSPRRARCPRGAAPALQRIPTATPPCAPARAPRSDRPRADGT